MSHRKFKDKSKFKRRDLPLDELKGILERAKAVLGDEDYDKLNAAVETLAFLTQELEAKGASIRRLRHLIFGPKTEKSRLVVGDQTGEAAADPTQEDKAAGSETQPDDEEKKPPQKRKGHGRRPAAEYTGAKREKVPQESLKSGDPCPECDKGKVYEMKDPKVLVRVKGVAPIDATVYELERLRCNLCGEVFTAQAPQGIGEEKYDESAQAMIGLLRYGCGMPFNRLERLEEGLGIPLPSGTQWEVEAAAAEKMTPAYLELMRQGAQGKVLHNDDTTAKILELCGQSRQEALAAEQGTEQTAAQKEKNNTTDAKTGVFTTGIVSVHEDHKIALFFTGAKHAGQNLQDVLAQRAEELGPPIQMCDMLSHNTAGDFETILAGCLVHSRRKYVEVADSFPAEVKHVLEELKAVYQFDAVTKKQQMSDEQRLIFHQQNSGPVMKRLKEWLDEQIEEKKVEPNSGLGQAIEFMRKHWDKLTLFLRVAGAPLDNNIVERALKKAICHRKNSMFYKTKNGARVGDMFMSFIHTAELNDVNAFDYLVTLLRHSDQVSDAPEQWMPWNYRQTLEKLNTTQPSNTTD